MKYTIKVNNTTDHDKWYYTRANNTFVCKIATINGRRYFVIDDMHKIPTEKATIVK